MQSVYGVLLCLVTTVFFGVSASAETGATKRDCRGTLSQAPRLKGFAGLRSVALETEGEITSVRYEDLALMEESVRNSVPEPHLVRVDSIEGHLATVTIAEATEDGELAFPTSETLAITLSKRLQHALQWRLDYQNHREKPLIIWAIFSND
ncbi:MAG: hypothetical protein H6626_03520 [Pseudobdellovibrionaceae bacterium]|nr:hypothetical protein [Bdellovibrionales bacterium]USN48171.1 MAG: hypothetical protein H6626_03520 [Pseudobdellovibrionaceae bacterium]